VLGERRRHRVEVELLGREEAVVVRVVGVVP
jgi:hypothetical protein